MPQDDIQEEEEAKVREVLDEDQEEENFILSVFACGSTIQPKKLAMELKADKDQLVKELCEQGSSFGPSLARYADLVDFDEHFADVTLDWTNQVFN